MSSPLVSICVPLYNSAKYLRQSLDSIVAQTYDNIEVIICDDASRDDSLSIARDYAERHGFQLLCNETNKGVGETSNVLIKMARGEYVAFYHTDDVYESTIVAEQVAVLNHDAGIGMVGTMANIMSEDGKPLGEFHLHKALKSLGKTSFSFDEVMLGALLNGGNDIVIVTPSVMARKSVYEELGAFNSDTYGVNNDYDMWLRIASRYRVAIIDARLMNYRIHANQLSQQHTRRNTELEKIALVLRDHRAHITDNKLARMNSRQVDKWIFRTAKRQNDFGYYERSNETLKLIESPKYMPLIWLLRALNGMNISTRRRS